MPKQAISPSVIRRLPRYYRFLRELELIGTVRISSRELSEQMGLTASQIRQDLNCFGGFGQQGYGYNVHALRAEIGKILGVDQCRRTILIGTGHLGRALATHMDFRRCGCELIGLFDANPFVAGADLAGMTIHHMDTIDGFCHQEQPEIAILCIPAEAAPAVAKRLVSIGIRAFWNFTHCDLQLQHPDILVEQVCLDDSLLTLTYGLNPIHQQRD